MGNLYGIPYCLVMLVSTNRIELGKKFQRNLNLVSKCCVFFYPKSSLDKVFIPILVLGHPKSQIFFEVRNTCEASINTEITH